MPCQLSHCSAMPSCESKNLLSAIFPSGPGTLNNWPLVRTPSTSMSRSLMRAARDSMSGFINSFLQASLPVHHHRVRLRFIALWYWHEETLAVGRGCSRRKKRRHSERLRLPGLEFRAGRNFHGHSSQLGGPVIEFLAISAPARVRPISIGDLPLSTRHNRPGLIHGKGPDINLHVAGLIGVVGHPTSIRRE